MAFSLILSWWCRCRRCCCRRSWRGGRLWRLAGLGSFAALWRFAAFGAFRATNAKAARQHLVMTSGSSTESSNTEDQDDSSDGDDDFVALAEEAAKVGGGLIGRVLFRLGLVAVGQFGYVVFEAFTLNAGVGGNPNLGRFEFVIVGRHHDGIQKQKGCSMIDPSSHVVDCVCCQLYEGTIMTRETT